ncbi:MAG: conjugal transfer protein TraR [Ignavibacteriae bacterium]|nr:conjugal transfer protein TraR [Ignavibacteriota bacterium]
MLIDSIIILLSIFGLWFGALWVVDSATHIAKKLGISELVIGLTVVAIATSAPEFAVTVSAALSGQSAISLGNVIGSNIFNLGLILGIVAIFSSISTNKTIWLRDGGLLVITGILLLTFYYDLQLVWYEGLILFTILVSYIVFLIKKKEPIEEEIPTGDFTWIDIPKIIVGIVLIIGSANFLVESATSIAKVFGVSDWLIGITIVAGGTSVPEFATSIVALIKGRHGISAGNLIGSDLFNMLGVLGVASVLRSISITESEYLSLLVMLINLMIFFIMLRTSWKITRIEGFILITIALFRWSLDFWI